MKNIFFYCLIIIPFFSFGQDKTLHQNLDFLRYQFTLNLHKNYTIRVEAEERQFFFEKRESQFIIRESLEKTIGNKFRLGESFTFSKSFSPQDPDATVSSIVNECRPAVYFLYTHPFSKKISLQQRLQQDIRFIETSNNFYEYTSMRSRYLIELNYLIDKHFSARLFNEILFNTQQNKPVCAFEQNRIGASIQVSLHKNWSVEIGYIKWLQQFSQGNGYYDRNILRFTLNQRISL